MSEEFEMSLIGEMTYFLGLQIKQCEEGIFISQTKYAKEMLTVGYKFTKDQEGRSTSLTEYRKMIESLLYLTTSRPDLM